MSGAQDFRAKARLLLGSPSAPAVGCRSQPQELTALGLPLSWATLVMGWISPASAMSVVCRVFSQREDPQRVARRLPAGRPSRG